MQMNTKSFLRSSDLKTLGSSSSLPHKSFHSTINTHINIRVRKRMPNKIVIERKSQLHQAGHGSFIDISPICHKMSSFLKDEEEDYTKLLEIIKIN